ncbi:unnamed protein product [Hymenolepis diminuta]|uniref:RING-type E3 ubiquitin transferase n=1 Tax=Hymenolepis diminuta TaxID=6216 RepID=A0A564Z253_HYMDI|nr:unnamed protein product [Hymenolepis diminuta]
MDVTGDSKYEELLEELNELIKCPLCWDPISSPSRTPCGHAFCFKCIFGIYGTTCPLCRKPFNKSEVLSCRATIDLTSVVKDTRPIPPVGYRSKNVEADKAITTELLRFETCRYPQFPYQLLQKFAKSFCNKGEFEEVIVNALGDIEEIKELKKIAPDVFIKCKNYPECNNRRCLHTLPWNMCKHGEACRFRSTCLAFHPVELMNLCFNVKSEGL